MNFSKSWKFLKNLLEDEYYEHDSINILTNMCDENYHQGEEYEEKNIKNLSKPCKNCAICCYKLLVKYNLFSGAYSLITLTYQYLLTLLVT